MVTSIKRGQKTDLAHFMTEITLLTEGQTKYLEEVAEISEFNIDFNYSNFDKEDFNKYLAEVINLYYSHNLGSTWWYNRS